MAKQGGPFAWGAQGWLRGEKWVTGRSRAGLGQTLRLSCSCCSLTLCFPAARQVPGGTADVLQPGRQLPMCLALARPREGG